MPIYEYQCSDCAREFEELIRNDREERKLTCPKCGSAQISRKLSAFAAHAASAKPAPPAGGCGNCGGPDGACPFNT